MNKLFYCLFALVIVSCKKSANNSASIDATAFVGSNDFKLYAIDLKTGNEKWEYATGGGIFGGPKLYDGTVYFGQVTHFRIDNSSFFINRHTPSQGLRRAVVRD